MVGPVVVEADAWVVVELEGWVHFERVEVGVDGIALEAAWN